MVSTTADKLRIKERSRILTFNEPNDFKKKLGPVPKDVTISSSTKSYDQIHWFVRNKAEMEKQLGRILQLMKEGVICWIYYPKGSSKIQTDLTRDKGWDKLMEHSELQWISLISFDEVWSSFGMRLKTEADQKKESKPNEREIFKWVDPAKKTFRLPDDLARAINRSKSAGDFFHSLSFTNKKEYIEWVVTAKREETRKERIKGSVDRLKKLWKNPRNI